MSRLKRHNIEVAIPMRKIQKSNRPVHPDKLSTLFKNLTKGKWKITLDESYFHETTIDAGSQHYYEQIMCRGRGFVYLLSESKQLLAFYAPNGTISKMLLASVPGTKMHIDCVTETIISFPFDKLQEVNKVIHFRHRRILTEEQREVYGKRLAEYRLREKP